MTSDFLNALDDDLRDDPALVAGAASVSDVSEIEAFTDFRLPSDYLAFVKKYGASIVGPYSVYGVGASEAMGQDEGSVIAVTKRFRADGWPGTQEALVISMDHAGNAITLDAQGVVHRFDHDTGASEVLASSFGDFIEKCLASAD